jgi:predicted nucleic acid-binding protein
MIVLDAGVLIAHLREGDPFHQAVGVFLEENEEFDWGVSAMTIAESLVHAVQAGRGVSVLSAVKRLEILQLGVMADDTLGLAEVRAATGLKMPDAIVVYSAERHGAELVTTDRAVARAAEARNVVTTLLTAV